MTMLTPHEPLAEVVEVVIGVDTHTDTHTAAVVDARTGAVLARTTVTADPDGYDGLLALGARRPAGLGHRPCRRANSIGPCTPSP